MKPGAVQLWDLRHSSAQGASAPEADHASVVVGPTVKPAPVITDQVEILRDMLSLTQLWSCRLSKLALCSAEHSTALG